MKTGCVIINSTDIYAAFGVYVTRGSYRSLIQWPSLKDIDKNDWMESDGEEPDLSALPLAPRSFTLQFAVRRGGDYEGFCDWLEAQHTLAVNVAEIGLTFTLRAASYPSFDFSEDGFDFFSVTFSEDAPDYHEHAYAAWPLEREENADLVVDESETYNIDISPDGGMYGAESPQFQLGGIDLTDYGVQVVKGTLSSVKRRSDLKEYLKRASKYSDGQTYDQNPALWDATAGAFVRATTEGTARHTSKEITLQCHLSARSAEQCWAYYYRFLGALVALNTGGDTTRAGVKTLAIRDLGVTAEVYYVSQSVSAFFPDAGHYWVDFSVTLRVISGLTEPILLAAEDGALVITEDGIYNIQI